MIKTENGRLRRVIQALTSREKVEIKKQWESKREKPTRTDLSALFNALCSHPEWDDATVMQQLKIQPMKELYLVKSYLFKWLETWIGAQKPEKGHFPALLEFYRDRALAADFERTLKAALQAIQQRPERDIGYYLEKKILLLHTLPKTTPEEAHVQIAIINAAIDDAWVMEKLHVLCQQTNRQALFADVGPLPLSAAVLEYAEAADPHQHPVMAAWLYSYRMLTGADGETYFYALKKTLHDQPAVFAYDTLRTLHVMALNYGIRRMNTGEKRYFRETLDLYKHALERNTLLENGYLSRFTYHNVAAIALQTGDLEWCSEFIEVWKNQLEPAHRQPAWHFNRAKLEYARRDLTAALALLREANYRDLLLNLQAKTLAIKVYYELREHEVLESHLTAMRQYIQRKRVLGYHRDNYLNLLRMTRKLLSLPPDAFVEKDALMYELERLEPLTEKAWLIDRIREIGNRPTPV